MTPTPACASRPTSTARLATSIPSARRSKRNWSERTFACGAGCQPARRLFTGASGGLPGYPLGPPQIDNLPHMKRHVHTSLLLQDEVHGDRGGNFHGLAVEQRRRVDPLAHRVERRTNKQRMPAQHLKLVNPPVGAEHAEQF